MTAVRAEDLAPLIQNGSRSRGVISRLRDVWSYRELLANLVRKELKVRYKDSVLGFAWALLNPLLYLVVFSFVFTVMLPFGVPRFGLLFLSGLLAWNLFSGGLTGATASIVANGPLVQKVWFPREILPIAAVGAAFINFLFQVVVLVAGLVVFWQSPKWSMIWLIPPALSATLLLSLGLGLLLCGLAVRYRDILHFIELALLMGFWLTPIVYQFDFMASWLVERFGAGGEWLAFLNPMIAPLITMQRVLYNPDNFGTQSEASFEYLGGGSGFFAGGLLISNILGLVLCFVGMRVFSRVEVNLGEEL